jgi:NAD-reducing hydrogenase small subunit
LQRVYEDNASIQRQIPSQALPMLLPRVRPVHEVVPVDLFVPGCPPSADTIYSVLRELLAGGVPDIAALTRFGA